MYATTLRRSTAYRASTMVDVAFLLSGAVEEGRALMVESSSRYQGRFAAREWELTRWFKRVAPFLDGLCLMLETLSDPSRAGGHTRSLAEEVQALASVVLDDEGQTLGHWGLREWRAGQWEVDNLELDFQLRARPEALLRALEALSEAHMAPLLARWGSRLGQGAAAGPWGLAS